MNVSSHDNLRTGDDAVATAREALWNGAATPRPFAVAECRSVADVQAAVRFAAAEGRPVSVLCGGHDWAGRAACEAGVMLDLRPMCSVVPDPDTATVAVGGGARTGDLLRGLPHDLVAVTGTITTVGVAGLTLGGGYGTLNSRFGLASDNLLRAEVVLADGSLVMADATHEPGLFWALRGGGGNFGAVTSLTLAVHRVPSVLAATIFVPLASARAGLLGIQRMLDDAPDELSIFSALLTGPTGERGLLLAPLWTGDEADGERRMDALARLEGAAVLRRGWTPYADTFDVESEKAWPKGNHYHLDARNLPRFDEPAADLLVACAEAFPNARSALVMHDFHGLASRIPSDATAFPLRRDHFVVEIVAGWDAGPREQPGRYVAWAQDVSERLSRLALPGGYPNLLGPGQKPRLHEFYGPAAARLTELKNRFDPANLFRSNIGQL